MKNTTIGALFIVFLFLQSCGQNSRSDNSELSNHTTNVSENVDNPNASPESVMNTIFQAAKTGEVGVLKFLLPPYDQNGEMPCDGDCIALCNPGNESMKADLRHNYISIEDFKNHFSNAKIIGSPTIKGNEAQVNFVFGPNLEINETMNLQKINGSWYLNSF